MVDMDNFKDEIKKRTDRFFSIIESEYREGFEYDREIRGEDKPGFPIFDSKDQLFYKSKFQEGYLEWLVRNELVNELLNYLFKTHNYDIRWRLDSPMTTGGYRNRENEEKFPVEFFIVKDGKNIAYRYTPFTADYSISLNLPQDMKLSYFKTGIDTIDQWVSIYWTENSRQEIIEKERLGNILKSQEPFQTIVTVKDLFIEYFCLEEYEIFIKGIKEAVAKANDLMGFQTISRLTKNNVAILKDRVANILWDKDFSKLQYQMVNEKGELIQDKLSVNISATDAKYMDDNFKGNLRYLALIGNKKHAQSFITSEYLLQIFQDGTAFDFTAVISGYIKAVEQLCACIVYDILLEKADPKVFIKSRRLEKEEIDYLKNKGDLRLEGKYLYVSMKRENKPYFDMKLTMGQLFTFLDINKREVWGIDCFDSEPKIYKCMQNYFQFDRNGYFHKHNISDYKVVQRIRNNTLLILYWLLGATVLHNDNQKNIKELGVVNSSFDKLFKKIAYRNCYRFTIKMKGMEECKVIRLPNRKTYSYDDYGYIKDAKLMFYIVKEFPRNRVLYKECVDRIQNNYNSELLVIIDRDNIPEIMHMINNSDETERLI